MSETKPLILTVEEQREQELDIKFLNPDRWYICDLCGMKQMVGYTCPHEGTDLDGNEATW